MSTDQITSLIDGIVMGVDVTLLVHFGGRIWDDYQARLDALVGGDEE